MAWASDWYFEASRVNGLLLQLQNLATSLRSIARPRHEAISGFFVRVRLLGAHLATPHLARTF
jgi:hypothetical protein